MRMEASAATGPGHRGGAIGMAFCPYLAFKGNCREAFHRYQAMVSTTPTP